MGTIFVNITPVSQSQLWVSILDLHSSAQNLKQQLSALHYSPCALAHSSKELYHLPACICKITAHGLCQGKYIHNVAMVKVCKTCFNTEVLKTFIAKDYFSCILPKDRRKSYNGRGRWSGLLIHVR